MKDGHMWGSDFPSATAIALTMDEHIRATRRWRERRRQGLDASEEYRKARDTRMKCVDWCNHAVARCPPEFAASLLPITHEVDKWARALMNPRSDAMVQAL